MSALAGEFVVHQGAADKFDWQDDWRKRGQRGWESGGRARPSAKHAPSFGAQAALARTDGKGQRVVCALGRPPERREVRRRRA